MGNDFLEKIKHSDLAILALNGKTSNRQPSGTATERCRTIRLREKRQTGNRKKGLRITTDMMVREGKRFNGRETAGTDRQTRIPGKDTQQGKDGEGKRAVKSHISEELGTDSISQTEVLWRKASMMLPKAVFFSRKVLSCFCF